MMATFCCLISSSTCSCCAWRGGPGRFERSSTTTGSTTRVSSRPDKHFHWITHLGSFDVLLRCVDSLLQLRRSWWEAHQRRIAVCLRRALPCVEGLCLPLPESIGRPDGFLVRGRAATGERERERGRHTGERERENEGGQGSEGIWGCRCVDRYIVANE